MCRRYSAKSARSLHFHLDARLSSHGLGVVAAATLISCVPPGLFVKGPLKSF